MTWFLYLLPFYDCKIFDLSLIDIGITIWLIFIIVRGKFKLINNLFLLVFAFLISLSTVISFLKDFSGASVIGPIIKFLVIICFVPCAIQLFSSSRQKVDQTVKRIFYLAIVFCLINFILFSVGFHSLLPSFIHLPEPYTSEIGTPRFNGIFSEPAHLGIFFGGVVFYLLKRKKCSFFILVLYSAMSVVSYSMASILLLVFNFAFYFAHTKLNARKICFFIAAAVFAICIAIFVPPISSRLANVLSFSDRSSQNRLIDSWRIAFKTPFFGLGLVDTTKFVAQQSVKLGINSYDNVYINNIFAAIYLLGGPISLVLFIIFLKSITKRNWWGFIFLILICSASGNFNAGITWVQIVLVSITSFQVAKKETSKSSFLVNRFMPVTKPRSKVTL